MVVREAELVGQLQLGPEWLVVTSELSASEQGSLPVWTVRRRVAPAGRHST